jgi:lambda family phage portal protein
MQSRVAAHLFEYQAAQANRLFQPKTNEQPAESPQTVRARHTMMYEARDLIANFSAIAGIPEKYALSCTPNEWSPATGDRDYDRKVSDYFHAWCKKADVTGRHSFRQLVGMALQMRPVDGDCGFALRSTRDGIRLQLVPADLIGNPQEGAMLENYIDGIVLDKFGTPVAYRIFHRDRNGSYTDPEDVPARAFCHYFDPFRADQYRGVSEFHAVINTARMLKGILDAEQVGVRFASQQAALVFNERGSASPRQAFSPVPSITLENGQQRKDELSDVGMIKYFNTSDKVEVMPSRPSSAFTGFVEHLMDEIAMGLGIPRGVLFGTQGYKGPNVRAEFAQADRVWDRQRGILTDKVLDPIKNDVLLAAIASGELDMPPAKDGETPAQALRRATKGEWRWPARMTIDVGRESAANLNEHRQGIKSGQQIAAEQGTDFESVLEQKAIEAALVREFSTKYGVPETAIQLITTSLPSTPAAAAASGENVGAAASIAQADSVPSQAGANLARNDFSRHLEVNLQPTAEMAAEAARGLEWRAEYNRGGTDVGVARARDISNRTNLSADTVSRMVSYFARHEVDKQGQGWSEGSDGHPSAGRIAWALWGGDAGRAWAERKQDEIENEEFIASDVRTLLSEFNV